MSPFGGKVDLPTDKETMIAYRSLYFRLKVFEELRRSTKMTSYLDLRR